MGPHIHMHLHMYIHTHTVKLLECEYTYVHMCIEARGLCQVSFSVAFYLTFRDSPSLNYLAKLAGQSSRDASFCVLGLQMSDPLPGFCVGARNLNSGLVCVWRALY